MNITGQSYERASPSYLPTSEESWRLSIAALCTQVATLFAFLNDTYAAAADAGHWDRTELECLTGLVGKPRTV